MKKLFAALSVCALFAFTGCIDREFELTDVSGEVTVGGEELILPLGEIEDIYISDLIGDSEMLKPNEEGVYQISFSSFEDDPNKYEKISIEGISIPDITGLSPELEPITFSFGSLPTSLMLSAIHKQLDIDFPTNIGDIMKIKPIKISQDIEFPLPDMLSGNGIIDDNILAILKMSDLATLSTKSENNEVAFNATLEILEQLEKVDWVEFGCENHPFGAPFQINIDLGGLNDIVGGGSVKLNVEFPEGYYLRNEDGSDLPEATHNIFSKEITIAPKQKAIDMVVYLHKIDYSDHAFTDGKLEIDDHIKYNYELSVTLAKGNYNLNNTPKILVQAEPEYKDVEIKINHFELPKFEHAIANTFNGIPSGVAIEKIAFTEDSNLNISLKGLEWLTVQDNITDEDISPKIEIDMPRCMHFREHPLLDENTNVLLADTKQLANGIVLSLEYIDCKNSEGLKQENGQLIINESIGASIHMESLDGHTVLVSTLTPPTNLDVELSLSEAVLNIDTANTVVTWSDDKSFNFDLKDNIPYISQTIEVPEMISEIKRIEIGKANSNEPLSMQFKLDAGKSFPVEELDINVSVNLGKLLHPTQKMLDEGIIVVNENGDYILSINEPWRPKEAVLVKTLEFDALENIPAINNGKITINQSFPVTGGVKIKSGENIILSDENDVKVDIGFKIDDIEVRTFTGKVDFSVESDDMSVDLGLGEFGGLDINALSVNPVLTLRLKDNPTGIGLNADIAIYSFDIDGNKIATIEVPTISIASSGASTIVISTSRNASKYDKEGVNFIPVDDFMQLLKQLPHRIEVEMKAYTNSNEEITIDLKKAKNGYDIEYQYEVVLPLEFDGNIDISYETTISGLNETFKTIADSTKGMKVGDVGLIAEFESTIPFNIVVSAELVNAEGTSEGISASLDINNCVLDGYNKDSDGEKKFSKIDLDFDLGESGSLEGLKNADGVRFKLSIYDTEADIAALLATQFVNGKLKLRVRDGLTVDIFDFLKQEGE